MWPWIFLGAGVVLFGLFCLLIWSCVASASDADDAMDERGRRID